MRLLELGRFPPDGLLLREYVESVGVDSPRGRIETLGLHRLGILEPDVLAVVVVNVNVQGRLEDRLARDDASLALGLLCLADPLLAREDGAVLGELRNGVGDDGVDLVVVALLFLQSPGGDPDLVRGWDRAPCLVENLPRAVGGLEPGEREPELLRVRDDLDRAREEDAGVFWVVLELDRLLPELDRGRNVLERCTVGPGQRTRGRRWRQRAPFLSTRFFALGSCSSSTARIQILTDCGISCTAFARMTLAFSATCSRSSGGQWQEATGGCFKHTLSSEAAIQTSSFFGQCSHPCAMILRAWTDLPATFSSQAAATQPGACFGFVLMSDWSSARARLMSLHSVVSFHSLKSREQRAHPISASVLRT